MTQRSPQTLFSMIEGFAPLRNLLGAGDPNVHWIDDRWWMFLGGFQPTFRNAIFAAALAPGEQLSESMRWQIRTEPNRPRRAAPLVPLSRRGQWDRYGMHEPCYVEGAARGDGGPVRRIYYTGRAARKVVDNESPYSIGMLELTPVGWQRYPTPVLTGDERYPSALGPKVIYAEGRWRMWFRATTAEPGRGQQPVAAICYTESLDGVTGWSPPRVFHPERASFAHAFVREVDGRYEMLLSKSPNLFGAQDYPEQKLWISMADRPSGDVADWSEPHPILDAANGPSWSTSGFFGASHCVPEAAGTSVERYLFYTGVHAPVHWPRTALHRIRTGRRPPVPAPYYFTIASTRVRLPTGLGAP